ncbi:MAG: hypothetical protein QOE70_6663 [Chthoniobacter sp.]|jgi:hypothetical protein|nr:hypothetical protein [Chthoniobacter sp.]
MTAAILEYLVVDATNRQLIENPEHALSGSFRLPQSQPSR